MTGNRFPAHSTGLERPDASDFWDRRQVIVTGGAGFLGRYVVADLRDRGAESVIAPRSRDYDLREVDAIRDLFSDAVKSRSDAAKTVVIHLAAVVGGIGANREHPAEFFYDNLVMGVHLLHEAYKAGGEKFVAVGTVCACPKYTPVPSREEDLWNGYPEETNVALGLEAKRCAGSSRHAGRLAQCGRLAWA